MKKFVNTCYWSVSALLTLLFVSLGHFVFRLGDLRTAESAVDLFHTVSYPFRYKSGNAVITVLDTSKVFSERLPAMWNDRCRHITVYFRFLFNKENFLSYVTSVGNTATVFGQYALIFLNILIVFFFVLLHFWGKPNVRHGENTLPLRLWHKLETVCSYPKRAIKAYLAFLKEHGWIKWIWIAVFACHLNIMPIILSFFAYYLYFMVALDFAGLPVQIFKLGLDLSVFLAVTPKILLLVVAAVLFDRFRKNTAVRHLRHMEAKNCGFIRSLPIVTMTCGSMGKKKTTMVTDMALSQDVMFLQDAFERLHAQDMKFPFFPWIKFEEEIRTCVLHGTIRNLEEIREMVEKKRKRYEKTRSATQIYGYDVDKYGSTHDDGLRNEGLFDVLSVYGQLYLIYITEGLIVSNYSIRSSNRCLSLGNFPLWQTDFFRESARETTRYARILDFDTLRLGKKVDPDNPLAGSFEYGVVVISEVGKERGNNLELKEVKKSTEETNQKNDLFNSWLKMCRHAATVDHVPFIKVFTDEQRPESWGADARDLADIIRITDSKDGYLTLPFYTLEEAFSEWSFALFMRLYDDFRYRRGDNTLLMYLLKKIVSFIYERHIRIINRYGYSILNVTRENITGKPARKKYFLMNFKIYSRRFSTDCFSGYFSDLAKKSKHGIMDYIAYANERATVGELKMQHSYFIEALYKDRSDG